MTCQPLHRLARIDRASRELGLDLADSQLQQLSNYLDLLQRWNRTYNLTAIRDEDQMLVQHLFDCLAVIPPLAVWCAARGDMRLLDVGSGGGLPGVIVAVCLPQVSVTCVDTVGKKAAFIRQVAGELKLRNLVSEHVRVESLRTPAFNLVTSRAFSSLELLVRLTRHLVSANGVWMAMKARTPNDEIEALPVNVEMFHVEQLHVPDWDAERCLVWIKQRPS